MTPPQSARTVLGWQQLRRDRGVPTVAVLVGPAGLGVREWRAWAAPAGRPVAQAAPDDTAAAWLAAAAVDLVGLAARWVAASTGGPPPDPARLTRYDLDQLWRGLPAAAADPVAAAAYRALAAAVGGPPAGPAGEPFAGVCGLDPEAAWPALLLVPTDPTPAAWFDLAVRDLARVAAAVPRLPVGVCVPAEVYDDAVLTSSRAMALAREGAVRLAGVAAAELAAQLQNAGVAPPPATATLRRLAEGGLAPDVAAAFVAAAVATRRPAPPPAEAADDFRSAEERFLFEQLESMPETAGLFRPNRPLEFLHGQRSAEADLVAAGLKLVVEVDGGYFHLTREAYRRDRRKDHLYQRHGYWVLRFLAEDVVDDLENILTTILAAVASRRPSAGPEVPARA